MNLFGFLEARRYAEAVRTLLALMALGFAATAGAAPVRDPVQLVRNSSDSALAGHFKVSTAQPQYQVGQALNFSVVSSRPGYFYAFNVAPSGEVVMLFPSGKSTGELRRPGTVKIPSDLRGVLRAAAPLGSNRLVYVASNGPLPIDELAGAPDASGLRPLKGKNESWLQGALATILSRQSDSSWTSGVVRWNVVAPPVRPPTTQSGPGFWRSSFDTAQTAEALSARYVSQLRAQGFGLSQQQRQPGRYVAVLERRVGGSVTRAGLSIQVSGGRALVEIIYR